MDLHSPLEGEDMALHRGASQSSESSVCECERAAFLFQLSCSLTLAAPRCCSGRLRAAHERTAMASPGANVAESGHPDGASAEGS